jgi:glycosyltransferase involved in cell wall biosynthesis
MNIASQAANSNAKGSVLVVGNFLSRSVDVRCVCEDLSERLQDSGWRVRRTSDVLCRPLRLLDMMTTAWRHRDGYEIAVVDVYSGLSFLWAEAVCQVLSRTGKPFVLTLHGGNIPSFARRWPVRVRRLLRAADMVTAPSGYLREQMLPFRSDIQLIPNAIDLMAYPYLFRPKVTPRLVWLRAFHEIYNPTLGPKVLALLQAEFPDVELVMIGRDKGDGSLQRTRELARQLGVSDRLQTPGGIPKRDVPSALNRGDIFLNTTRVDNTPISVLEAMACGLPVVSTKVGGIPYLLEHRRTALLTADGDAREMAEAIRTLLREPEQAAGLSLAGRDLVGSFSWQSVLPQWQNLLNSVRQRRRL